MHRELGAQFLVTSMEIAPISFFPAHHRINNQESRAENARHITLASVIWSWRAVVKIYPKPEEIFLCCSSSSYLPFTRPMTGLNMQQSNTNQAASSAPRKKKRLNFTFLGNNVNTSTITRLASSVISIRAQFNSARLLWICDWPFQACDVGLSEASLASVSAGSAEVMSSFRAHRARWDLTAELDPEHSIQHLWNKRDIDPWLGWTQGPKPEQ